MMTFFCSSLDFERKIGHLRTWRPFFSALHLIVGGILDICEQWRRQELSMGGRGVETLSRVLTSMLSLMTRLRKAEIHTFVSEERKLYYNYSMSHIPQKLIANYAKYAAYPCIPQKLIAKYYNKRVLTVPRAGDRSYVTGSIHGWTRSHLT